MKYNDKKKVQDKGFLSGRDWYEIQAFRALNQALGRCIRHRKDWGAILMVDSRYSNIQRYVESLSKWVRNGVHHHHNCKDVLEELTHFSKEMEEMDQQYKEEMKKLQPKIKAEPEVKPAPPAILAEVFEKARIKGGKNERKTVPINQWVSQHNAKAAPKAEWISKPMRFENPVDESKENSPVKKKFRFTSPPASNSSNLESNEEKTDTFKFKSLNTVSPPVSSLMGEEETKKSDEKPVIAKRKGFVPPRQKPDFYGDDDSDDDFQ